MSIEKSNVEKNSFPEELESIPGLEDNLSPEEAKLLTDMWEKLPFALQQRWSNQWLEKDTTKEEIFSDLERILSAREKKGDKVVRGYHVSRFDLPVGSYLHPDENGEVYYSENIKKLYGKPGGGFIYVVDGTSKDKLIDENLGWRKTKGKLLIVKKYPINEETQEQLGFAFGSCEYH